MKKRWMYMLALCMIFALGMMNCNMHKVSATVSDYEYEILQDGTMSITRYIGNGTEVVIPDNIGGLKVTRIDGYAFSECKSLTSITIPDTVTSIGYSAFSKCNNLTSITIPSSVVSIEGVMLQECDKLTQIKVDGNNAVYNSKNDCNAIIETATNKLIQGCSTTQIPEDVTCIGDSSFYKCSNLTSIKIPDSVTNIDVYAFAGCSSLASVTLSNNLKLIDSEAFSGCESLTNITLPEKLESIGLDAFSGCKQLTEIRIPSSVTSITSSTFSYCENLKKLEVDSNNTIYNSSNGCNAIIETAANALVQGCSTTTIPDNVTRIKSSAFEGSGIKKVKIPAGVQEINEAVFSDCKKLTSITIPKSVKTIENHAFYGCSKLKSVKIPNGVECIGALAFYGCNKLTNITIPNSVEFMYSGAFDGSSLKSMTIKGNVIFPNSSARKFPTGNGNMVYYVVKGSSAEKYAKKVKGATVKYIKDTLKPSIYETGDSGYLDDGVCCMIQTNTVYNRSLNIRVLDNSGIKKVTLNGHKVKVSKAMKGFKIKKKGKYTLKVEDKAGNKNVVKFTIKK